MQRGSEVTHIVVRNTGDRNTAILGQIDMVLVHKLGDLLRRNTQEGKHANLVRNVLPVVLGAMRLVQQRLELQAHIVDTVSHTLHLLEPLSVQLRVREHKLGNTGAVHGRVRVHGANRDLELAFHTLGLFGIGRYEREQTAALTVQTHVLGKALAECNLVALFYKVAHSKCVAVWITTSKALICHVKEREHLLLLYNVRNLFPLLLRWIHTCRVVRTCVEQDDTLIRRVPQVLQHTFEVQSHCFLVVVRVLLHLQARVLEDRAVVAPRRRRQVHLLAVWVVAGEEFARNAERSRTRDTLGRRDPVFLQWLRVSAVGKRGSQLLVVGVTCDGQVLLVEIRFRDALVSLKHTGQHIRQAVLVTVRTHTQVDLAWIRVALERLGDTENGIRWTGLYTGPHRLEPKSLRKWPRDEREARSTHKHGTHGNTKLVVPPKKLRGLHHLTMHPTLTNLITDLHTQRSVDPPPVPGTNIYQRLCGRAATSQRPTCQTLPWFEQAVVDARP